MSGWYDDRVNLNHTVADFPDVQLFQESLTSRTIEIGYVTATHFRVRTDDFSTVLNSLSVVIKKYKGLEIKGFEIGFWDSKREELRAPSFGAMQIWKVLERDKLVSGIDAF